MRQVQLVLQQLTAVSCKQQIVSLEENDRADFPSYPGNSVGFPLSWLCSSVFRLLQDCLDLEGLQFHTVMSH